MAHEAKYIPALNQRWLTPLYDPLLRWVMREEQFKRPLIAQAALRPGQRVLDLGCGTGTLALLIKQSQPSAEVVGLDADPQILEIARAKAAQAGVNLTLDHGMAFDLPYPDASFDRVLSSLVLHHLTAADKQRTLQAVYRVLRPGGEFHIVDFGPPHGWLSRLIAPVMTRFERAADNVQGRLPDYLRRAGFRGVAETGWFTTVFGSLSLYRAAKPPAR